MSCQPRGDTVDWDEVLAHRPPDTRAGVRDRFLACGVTIGQVHAALVDGGDALHVAAGTDDPQWTKPFGGPLVVALLAAEVSSLAAHLNSRASAVRARAVDELLADFSAVTVAAHLGISRQKVYDIGRGGVSGPFIGHVPWQPDTFRGGTTP